MPQTEQLLETLKRSLKAQRKTYRDLAELLDLSEASIKRLFSERNLSLQRLDRICEFLGLEISDLVHTMHRENHALSRLSREQEQEIAADLSLLLVTVCALNRWTMPEMLAQFRLSEPECIRCLTRLDRLGLIELLPENRIKLRVAANFAWRPDGPIQRFFQEHIKEDFFRSRFDRPEEQLLVVTGMLSPSSREVFQRRLQRLVREFDQLNEADVGLPLEQRFGTTVVMAMRPWRFGVFSKMLRETPNK